MQARIKYESKVSGRQPKTDRLILDRLLRDAGNDKRIDEEVRKCHEILIRWADVEHSGRLTQLSETQLQGDFLTEVFGDALRYRRAVENETTWNLEQHYSIGGETPDAVLGIFHQGQPKEPMVIVELKGPTVDLDRHRSNGRTAVDQCWDYLNNTAPTCRWGIVSNMVGFRLYERDSSKRVYEHFTLQSLRNLDQFRRFFVLFRPEGLLLGAHAQPPLATKLLHDTRNRQTEVGDRLYELYSENRIKLIAEIHHKQEHDLDSAIEMAQRLLDRIIFIAFCEDRKLLPLETIAKTSKVGGMSRVRNPKWQSFKNLFRIVDRGDEERYEIPGYNGGLFQEHPVDDLELDDEPWTTFFNTIGGYDFADEVNLDVLGHLFERSITELEKLKLHGLFGGDLEKAEQYARMPQSVKRKQLGIYYTPSELTSRIVQYTVSELIGQRFTALAIEHGIAPAQARRGAVPEEPAFWRGCLDILRRLKIVDPACGSGAFLFQAYSVLEHNYHEVVGHLENPDDDAGELVNQIPHFILNDNLYGVDVSPEAVEITQLALWIRSASYGQLLANLSRNIVHGNSLVHDPAVHPDGFDWRERFPEVFDRPESGFDCVIGNPPWERIKLQEREFFSLPAPEIATATNAAKRRQLVVKLEKSEPALYAKYLQALANADSLLTYCRKSNQYPLTGKGDINTYAVFAELAYKLVAPHGRVGLLTPSGIASDNTTKDYFAAIAESNRLIRLYDFENKKTFFPEVHASFKFCIFNFGGAAVEHDAADFIFFVHQVEELDQKQRHIPLTGADIKLLNPNTRTCPIFRTRRDAEITKAIYRRVPILIDQNRTGPTGNLWGISFKRMFDQTNDANLFRDAETLKADGYKLKGNRWIKGKSVFLPLYEAKMIQAYDHRAASVVTDQANWLRQGQTDKTNLVEYQNPEYMVMPRFWIDEGNVDLPVWGAIGFKDITSPTNQRTMIAAAAPRAGFTNHFVLMLSDLEPGRQLCLLANMNSFVYDYISRQKIGGVTLNFFIVEQLPTLPPDVYDKPCPWFPKVKLSRCIRDLVLLLSCTSEDMLPLAEACDFECNYFKKEYSGRLSKWDETERAEISATLDAAYFHLYGITRDDAEYILTTFPYTQLPNPSLPNRQSTADYIMHHYDQLSESFGD